MPTRLKWLVPRRLAVKLVLSLTVAFAIVEAITQYINVHRQEKQLLDSMILGADQLSRSIAGATWQAMLTDHRDAAYQVMQDIASKQGIDHIRIYNRDGKLMFSTGLAHNGHLDTSEAVCSPCHAGHSPPRVNVSTSARSRVMAGGDGQRKLAMVTPIYNEPACSASDCHAHPSSIRVLGVIDVGIDLTPVDRAAGLLRLRSLAVGVAQIALIAVIVVAFTARFVSAPIRQLIHATTQISALQLDRPIHIDTSEELGDLARSFDRMRERLKAAADEKEGFTQQLEAKVEERTAQLRAAQQKLIKNDRLASLGQLAASVAHEINNPLSGVLNLSMLMQRIVDRADAVPPERLPEFRRYLAQVANETSRVGRIVADLLTFSRRSRRANSPTDLNTVVTNTVSLVNHKLLLANVQLNLQLGPDIPRVPCDASQFQQVVMNLVLNAAEAIPSGGSVTVRTAVAADREHVSLEVEDTGVGIPEPVIDKIFDPFFTTKEEGKGVGLGLAVVYGIVQAHGGEIDVKTKLGEGTLFRVSLPLWIADETGVQASQTVR